MVTNVEQNNWKKCEFLKKYEFPERKVELTNEIYNAQHMLY